MFEGIHVLSLLLVLSFGLYQVHAAHLSPGQFILLQGLIYNFLKEYKNIINEYKQLREVEVDMQNIIGWMQKESIPANFYKHKKNNTTPNCEILRAQNISFTLPPNKVLLRKISLTVMPNQKIAITGVSGIGKSTFLKCLVNLYSVEEGIVYINNIPIKEYDEDELQQLLYYIPQNATLFNNTIYYNLTWGLKNIPNAQEISSVLHLLQLDSLYNLPNDLNTQVGGQGSSLSGGECQRIIIARALLSKPSLLIMDEALNALDTILENKLTSLLFTLVPTIILVSHEPNILSLCDIIYELDNTQTLIIKKNNTISL